MRTTPPIFSPPTVTKNIPLLLGDLIHVLKQIVDGVPTPANTLYLDDPDVVEVEQFFEIGLREKQISLSLYRHH